MSKRTEAKTTLEFLESAPLPQGTSSYTVIPHKAVNDKVMEELALKGFDVEEVVYKAATGAQVATGTVILRQGKDNEMRMMFTWANSYDKSMRFKCAIGGYLPQSGSIVVSGNLGSWGRKHTGTADTEMVKTIQDQLSLAHTYYDSLIEDKEIMKQIVITRRRAAEILGILYLEHCILTGEQLGIIKQELKKPSFTYNTAPDSLWALYCHIILALQKSNPRKWLDQQRLVHFFMDDMYGFDNLRANPPVVLPPAAEAVAEVTAPVVDPRQMDLVTEAEKAEGQYDITKEE